MTLTHFIKSIKERLEKATPGEYEIRCRDLSNHPLPGIWSAYGWIDELPKDYRTPTYEMFAHASTDLETCLKLIEDLVIDIQSAHNICQEPKLKKFLAEALDRANKIAEDER